LANTVKREGKTPGLASFPPNKGRSHQKGFRQSSEKSIAKGTKSGRRLRPSIQNGGKEVMMKRGKVANPAGRRIGNDNKCLIEIIQNIGGTTRTETRRKQRSCGIMG